MADLDDPKTLSQFTASITKSSGVRSLKGRALQLFREFQARAANTGNPFGVCRVILMARVIPEQLTPETDDPALEERLETAIRNVSGGEAQR